MMSSALALEFVTSLSQRFRDALSLREASLFGIQRDGAFAGIPPLPQTRFPSIRQQKRNVSSFEHELRDLLGAHPKTHPVLPFLVFLGGGPEWHRKPLKKQGFFIPTKALKSLEKKGKTLKKKGRLPRKGKKQGIQKKTKGGTGQKFYCPSYK